MSLRPRHDSNCTGSSASSGSKRSSRLSCSTPKAWSSCRGSAGEIMKRVDGTPKLQTTSCATWKRHFPSADLRADVSEFLEIAHGKGWIRTT